MWKKLSKGTRKNTVTYLLVIVTYLVMSILQSGGHLSNLISGMLVLLCVYAIMAVSLNLTVGVLGELSLGHAGFMCVGAFSSALFTQLTVSTEMNANVRFIFAIVIGIVTAAVFGFMIGIPVLRLKGDYLAIVTLAFGEIIKNLCNVLFLGKDSSGIHVSMKDTMSLGMGADGVVIINGPQGITRTPKQATFLIGMLILLISLIIVLNLINSRTGRAIMSIRDNRIAAESVGINVTKYKLLAFTVSAAIAGAAGALYAHNTSSLMATSAKFGYNMSIMFLVFVVLGGIGNMRGGVIAAVLLTVLPEVLRFAEDKRMLIYAIVLILAMLWNWAPAARTFREKYGIRRILAARTGRKVIGSEGINASESGKQKEEEM